MDRLAADFRGGFFTIAALMLMVAARALSRTFLALTRRIVDAEGLNAPLQEVPS